MFKKSSLLATGLALTIVAGNSIAGAIIYEPFDDLDPTLAGNTGGIGLAPATWSGAADVAGTSLSYGSLATSGGRVIPDAGGNQFSSSGINVGSTLVDAGLMADGAELWFSTLIYNHANTSSATNDHRTYVSLGTGAPDGFDRIGGNDGAGFTVALSKSGSGNIQARGWNDNQDSGGPAFGGALVNVPLDTVVFAVGKITWGEFNVTDDVFELYLPDTDLNLGSVVSMTSANFDQLGTTPTTGTAADNIFDTIGLAGARNPNGVPEVDEIRFGATYADVAPSATVIPEPASLLAGMLGLGALAMRRRRNG